jgi:iron complex outermembrane receptor protein
VQPSDIVVTARRKEERLQDVPKVIDVVSDADLRKNNIVDFSDIQQLTPGVNLQDSKNGLVQNTSMRGVSFDVNSGENSTVAFYWNDGGTQANYIYQTMYDIGQIEVLKGPQGTLRGVAAPSGSITITTKAPDLNRLDGYVEGSVGSDFYGENARAAINLPVIAGKLAVRVAGSIDDNDLDGVHSANPTLFPDKPYKRSWSERISARFEPTDNLQINGVYQRYVAHQLSYAQTESTCLFNAAMSCADPANGSAYYGVITPDQRLSTVSQPRTIEQQFDMFNLRADWHVLGQKLSYVGQYAISHLHPANPQDFAGYYNWAYPSGADYRQKIDSRNQYETNEIRISSEQRIAGTFDYTAGLYSLDTPTSNSIASAPQLIPASIYNSTMLVPLPGGGSVPLGSLVGSTLAAFGATNCTNLTALYSCAAPALLNRGDRKEHAAFGNLTAHLMDDRLELTAGLRYLHDRNIHHFLNNALLESLGGGDVSVSKVIWTASASYHFTPSILGYVSAGSSFRQGLNSVGPLAQTISVGGLPANVASQYAQAKDESSTSYEVGLKTQFLDHRGTLNLAYYHQDFTNFQYSAPTFVWVEGVGIPARNIPPSPAAVNGFLASVPAKVNGVDIDGSFAWTKEFNTGFAFSWSKGNLEGAVPCNGPLGPASVSAANPIYTCTGLPTSFVPRWNLSLHGEYDRSLNANLDGYIRAQATVYPGSVYNPGSPYDLQSSYAILSAFVGIRSANGLWDLTLFAKNLTNTKTVLATYGGNLPQSTATAGALAALRLVPAQVQGAYAATTITPPRQIGVTLRMAFGSQ